MDLVQYAVTESTFSTTFSQTINIGFRFSSLIITKYNEIDDEYLLLVVVEKINTRA